MSECSSIETVSDYSRNYSVCLACRALSGTDPWCRFSPRIINQEGYLKTKVYGEPY